MPYPNNYPPPLSLSIRPPRGRCRNPAFSLIELLSAIAVVAILATIIIAVINRATVSATNSAAISNLRQLALAHLAYASDNDFRLPALFAYDHISWQKKIQPYLNLESLDDDNNWIAMRMDPNSIFNVPDSLPPDQREFGATSIAMNYMLDVPGGLALNTVARPSSLALLIESIEYNSDAVNPSDSPGPPTPGYRRDNGTKALVAFCDGRVEPLSKEALGLKYFVRESVWWEWDI